MTTMHELFGEPISIYTRAQALEDGFLVDAGELAKEAGFRWPVALTRAAWESCVTVPEGAEGIQDEVGRLWDVLMVARWAMRTAPHGVDRVPFTLRVVTTAGGQVRVRQLVAHVGPGDTAEPVLTILEKGED